MKVKILDREAIYGGVVRESGVLISISLPLFEDIGGAFDFRMDL